MARLVFQFQEVGAEHGGFFPVRCLRADAIHPREPARNEFLRKVLFTHVDKSIKARDLASSLCRVPARDDREGLRKKLLRRIARSETGLNDVFALHAEIASLLIHPLWKPLVIFRRIDKVEAENVFAVTLAHVKAIAVIIGISDQHTVRQCRPFNRG